MRPLTYAGIGSRSTPPDVLQAMRSIGYTLAERGWILRSGNAPGADLAFQEGAWEYLIQIPEQDVPHVEVYLPWREFGAGDRVRPSTRWYSSPTPDAIELAFEIHPTGRRLSRGATALHARNGHQILGRDLASPVDAIICWTPDGAQDLTSINRGTGGTGQGLRVGCLRAPDAQIFNLARPGRLIELQSYIMEAA